MDEPTDKAPGLKWRVRKDGRRVPYWFPPVAAVRGGYPVKSANLAALADDPVGLAQRLARLQAELMAWRHNRTVSVGPVPPYDGTFGALIEIYVSDPESPFHSLKSGSRHPYLVYARKLKAHIGDVQVSATDGRQVKRWFALWSGQEAGHPRQHATLAAGRMALTVMKAAVSFGVVCRNADCLTFKTILSELEFPTLKPRAHAPSAQQVTAARAAAHAAGAPERALAYALQFETTLRQWDVIGQWLDLSDPRPSTIIAFGRKWIGPTWASIDETMTLHVTHGKTEETTGARGTYDLKECPMVMDELARIPLDQRAGPLIVSNQTGFPYRHSKFREAWRRDATAAGIDKSVWNRDLRAGGHTEASMGGAHVEDRAKMGGHSKRMNAKVYDRDTVEAHRRVMRARRSIRKE